MFTITGMLLIATGIAFVILIGLLLIATFHPSSYVTPTSIKPDNKEQTNTFDSKDWTG